LADEFAGITVDGGTVSHKDGSGPLAGAKATVEPVGEAEPKRGLFKKKIDDRKLTLTVTGDGYTFVETLDPENGKDARKFADRINLLSSEVTSDATPVTSDAAPSTAPTESSPPNRGSIAAEFRRLAELRDTGVLSTDDYEAEKAKLLH
jgi:hypothetical protein